MHHLTGIANLYLRPVGNVFCTLSNEPDCFHASVREGSITSKLREAFDGILEWINDGQEISFKDACCKHITWFYNVLPCHALQIIVGNIPHEEARCMFNFSSLSDRHDSLCSKLFRQLVVKSHILQSLLLTKRDCQMMRWLVNCN